MDFLMVIMAISIALGRIRGHAPTNRLTETCNIGLQCNSLIFDIHSI